MPANTLLPSDWAYAAGIIDGEGCISARMQLGRSIIVSVRVANTKFPLLEWLQERFGGHIWVQGRTEEQNKKWAKTWVWEVAAKQAQPFLEGVTPYLVLKAKQAYVALEAISTRYAPKNLATEFGKPSFVSDETIEIRRRCVAELHILNKRGV